MARQMKDSGIEWIGEIPTEWHSIKVKYTSWLKGRIGWDGLKSTEYTEKGPYLITGTDFSKGMINWKTCVHISEKRFEEDVDIHIQENDLLITKDGTVGKVAIAKYCPPKVSLNSGVLLIRNLSHFKYDAKYMYFVLLSDVFWRWYQLSQAGQSTIKHLYQEQFYNFEYPFPPLAEQHRIADFLDHKCAEIDAVIERTKGTIEEYKKLKQAVITEAVTKGVRGARKMKDSGIEMIGSIPSDWACTRVSRIATVVRGGSPRPAGDSRFFNGNFIPWITVAEVTNTVGHYITSTETCLTEEGAKCSRIVEAGTLLLSNSGATLGVPKITNIRGCINDGSVAFYNLEIDKKYLLYVFASYTDELRKQRQGYGQPNLNTDIIKGLYIPQPPEYEQEEIVAYLDEKCTALDALIAKKTALLTELETYKKSLIYEVVTGKKEVV